MRYLKAMATNPDNSNEKDAIPGAPKPRATLVMKKGAASTAPVPAPAAPKAASATAASTRKQVVDRAALGLSAARPSEMIQGLDEAAKRAEAQATREEAKRRSGGKMNLTEAIHVDDTGARWSRNVLLGLVGTVLFVALVVVGLIYLANRTRINPRVASDDTRSVLHDLARRVELMPSFEESESVTAPQVKERLKKALEDDMNGLQEQRKRDQSARRLSDPREVANRAFVEKLLKFQDGWGKPLVFDMEDKDTLVISSNSKYDGQSPDPVKVRIRGSAPPVEEKQPDKSDEKSKDKK